MTRTRCARVHLFVLLNPGLNACNIEKRLTGHSYGLLFSAFFDNQMSFLKYGFHARTQYSSFGQTSDWIQLQKTLTVFVCECCANILTLYWSTAAKSTRLSCSHTLISRLDTWQIGEHWLPNLSNCIDLSVYDWNAKKIIGGQFQVNLEIVNDLGQSDMNVNGSGSNSKLILSVISQQRRCRVCSNL